MFLLIVLWLISFTLSFGVAGLIFIMMKKAAKKPWRLKIDYNYKPKISILVPTYNEANIIRYKLDNLIRLNYPRDLMQIIVVDSNSEDQTTNIVYDFIKHHPESNIQVLTQNKRTGKSAALNLALKNCEGEVIIVSDADCFWPPNILEKALPFLADPSVGAVSGPKILLNPNRSWVTRTEDAYLNSMNLVKLGESKVGSTLLFEGGFSAYKKEALTSFDPYNTGSDDCGTVLMLVENGYKVLMVPDAGFYSAFPRTWTGKLGIKIRRANQVVRVFLKYLCLLIKNRIKVCKRTVAQGVLLYIISPLMFVLLVIATVALLPIFPFFLLLFLVFLVPNLGVYMFEVVQNYCLLFASMLMVVFNRRFVVWTKPEDRTFIQENVLRDYRLI
jgi:cellulose synthase/poly-beta-1,6-N-acetylglucosamine synthase-like glycosyltransferase